MAKSSEKLKASLSAKRAFDDAMERGEIPSAGPAMPADLLRDGMEQVQALAVEQKEKIAELRKEVGTHFSRCQNLEVEIESLRAELAEHQKRREIALDKIDHYKARAEKAEAQLERVRKKLFRAESLIADGEGCRDRLFADDCRLYRIQGGEK